MRYVACIALLVLVLGLGTINFQHHLNLPTNTVNTIDQHSELNWTGLHTVSHVWLSSVIKEPEKYRDIMTLLARAGSNDVIIFHLGGQGGRGDAMQQIISAVKSTKATTVMLVETSVFSAHAYLAVAGDYLDMSPHTMLMFHSSSFKNEQNNLCKDAQGKTDRGQNAYLKCLDLILHMNSLDDELIIDLPILTSEEKVQVINGWDVFITDTEYKKRMTR